MKAPEGWTRCELGSVAHWGSGGTPKAGTVAYYGGDIPWAVIGDLSDGPLLGTAQSITEEGLTHSSAKWVPKGAVLVAMYGSIGKLGLTRVPLTTNQAIAHAVPNGRVTREYLFYYLLSQRRELDRAGKGATQRNIGQGTLKAWPIAFPADSMEQRRIVEIVEDHLSHLDAADASLTLASRRLDAYLRGEIDSAVWSNPTSTAPLGSLLAEPMRNGRSDRASATGIGTRTLTLTAVTRREFSDRYTKITSTPPEAAEPLWLRNGDILVQRSNTPELVGTSARYEGAERWAIFPDLLIRLRADERQIDSRYLALVLRSERAHRALRSQARGLAGSMPKIDQATIAAVRVPLVGHDDQNHAIAAAREAQERTQRALEAITLQQSRSQALRRAVLAAAFSGRLTGASSDAEVIQEVAAQ